MQQPPNPYPQFQQPSSQQPPDTTQPQTSFPPQQPPIPPKKRMSRTDKLLFAVLGAILSIFIMAVIIAQASTSATHDLNATITANAENLTATAIANNATVSAGTTAITSDLTPTVDTIATAESNAVSTAIANSSAQLTAEALTPTVPPTPAPTFATFTDGNYQVGIDIQPGTYRTTTGSQGCYYARLKGFSGSLDDI
jgi:hypothetical protein